MGINIRAKGATGEQQLATELNTLINVVRLQLGIPVPAKPTVQRNQNQSAVGGQDLVGTFGYAIEVKRQEQLSIGTWWKQCVTSAEHMNEEPVLIYRQNKQAWRVVMYANVTIQGTSQQARVMANISFDDFKQIFTRTVMHHLGGVSAPVEVADENKQVLFPD